MQRPVVQRENSVLPEGRLIKKKLLNIYIYIYIYNIKEEKDYEIKISEGSGVLEIRS